MGVDFGKKRIGIAISDEAGKIAFPHSIIANSGTELKEVIDLASAQGITTVVVGESKNFKGDDNVIMRSALEFCDGLKKAGYNVVLEPEIYSTMQAERIQGRQDDIDASAASVILQSFLDRKNDDEQGGQTL